MARSENILLKMLRGQIGKQLVIKQWGNKTIVTSYPDMSNRKLSAKQKAVNEKMAEANDYARAILLNAEKTAAAQVRLNVTRNRLYTALISEYFRENKSPDPST